MRVGIHVIPYNHLMRRARKERDLTQAELAELVGVAPSTLGNIERMIQPVTEARAIDIASILGYEPDDLFPVECRDKKVSSIDFVIEVESLECIEARDVTMLALPDPSEIVHRHDIEETVRRVLKKLSLREQQILKMRFGLGGEEAMTLEKVAAMFGVSCERIRQIEASALGRLRHPSKSRHLKALL